MTSDDDFRDVGKLTSGMPKEHRNRGETRKADDFCEENLDQRKLALSFCGLVKILS